MSEERRERQRREDEARAARMRANAAAWRAAASPEDLAELDALRLTFSGSKVVDHVDI